MFRYILLLTFVTHKKGARYLGFRDTFAALIVLNYWLREFPLFAVANRFELKCESKATNASVLQNLPLFMSPSFSSKGGSDEGSSGDNKYLICTDTIKPA